MRFFPIICLIVLLYGSAAIAQPPERFIQFYSGNSNLNTVSSGIALNGSGYILAGTSVDTANGTYNSFCLMGIDSVGNKKWEKIYGTPGENFITPRYLYKDFIKHKGRFYAVNSIAINNLYATVLMCFNELGDTCWTKHY